MHLARPLAVRTLALPTISIGAAAAVVTTVATLIYLVAGPEKVHDAFQSLADAFLAGRLVVPDGVSQELVPRGDGWSYVPFPPVPALPDMLPISVSMATWSALAGGALVGLVYPLARNVGAMPRSAVIIQVAIATSIGWVAATGGTWLYAQLLGAALATGALVVTTSGKWPIVAGALLGLAAGSRLPLGLLLPLVFYLYRAAGWRAWVPALVGVAAIALPIAAYNVARFGSPIDFGYAYIASWNGVPTVLGEQWYADGILSLTYMPRSLGVMLLSGFDVVTDAPWLRPDWSGLSIALTMPALLLALGGWRSRLGAVAIAVAVLVMLPNWAHGNWGFHQYGYRFAIDAIPALVIALAVAYRERPSRTLAAAIIVAAAVNAYGLWAAAVGFIVGPTTI